MRQRINVLITGHGGSDNRGCQAILKCTLPLIREALQDARITVLSRSPSSDQRRMPTALLGVKVRSWRPDLAPRYSAAWFWKLVALRFCRVQTLAHLRVNERYYRRSDLVIFIGGDNFTDDYGRAHHHFEELHFARSLGCKTVLWSVSIGPFKCRENELRRAADLRRADLITAREAECSRYLAAIGVEHNVRRVADPAFLLVPRSVAAFLREDRGSHTRIGIGMSDLLHCRKRTKQDYFTAFLEMATHLLREAGCELVLVPHVTKTGVAGEDDHALCLRLARELNMPASVRVASAEYGADEMKYVIGQCDYFIGARTHSTIASLSSLVPTITIGYSSKALGVNQDCLGHARFVIPEEEVSAGRLIDKLNLLKQEGPLIREHLADAIPRLRLLAESGGRYLSEITNGRSA